MDSFFSSLLYCLQIRAISLFAQISVRKSVNSVRSVFKLPHLSFCISKTVNPQRLHIQKTNITQSHLHQFPSKKIASVLLLLLPLKLIILRQNIKWNIQRRVQVPNHLHRESSFTI